MKGLKNMDQVQDITIKIKDMLIKMGFSETVLTNPYRSETNYVRGSLYCIPLSMGENAILSGLANEICQAITRSDG
jgi:hypothetical protein